MGALICYNIEGGEVCVTIWSSTSGTYPLLIEDTPLSKWENHIHGSYHVCWWDKPSIDIRWSLWNLPP
jgi:hypothetical protein